MVSPEDLDYRSEDVLRARFNFVIPVGSWLAEHLEVRDPEERVWHYLVEHADELKAELESDIVPLLRSTFNIEEGSSVSFSVEDIFYRRGSIGVETIYQVVSDPTVQEWVTHVATAGGALGAYGGLRQTIDYVKQDMAKIVERTRTTVERFFERSLPRSEQSRDQHTELGELKTQDWHLGPAAIHLSTEAAATEATSRSYSESRDEVEDALRNHIETLKSELENQREEHKRTQELLKSCLEQIFKLSSPPST